LFCLLRESLTFDAASAEGKEPEDPVEMGTGLFPRTGILDGEPKLELLPWFTLVRGVDMLTTRRRSRHITWTNSALKI